MIHDTRKPSLPNQWGEVEPDSDPRLPPLFALQNVLDTVLRFAWPPDSSDRANPDPGPTHVVSPLQLAAALIEIAQDLRDFTTGGS